MVNDPSIRQLSEKIAVASMEEFHFELPKLRNVVNDLFPDYLKATSLDTDRHRVDETLVSLADSLGVDDSVDIPESILKIGIQGVSGYRFSIDYTTGNITNVLSKINKSSRRMNLWKHYGMSPCIIQFSEEESIRLINNRDNLSVNKDWLIKIIRTEMSLLSNGVFVRTVTPIDFSETDIRVIKKSFI